MEHLSADVTTKILEFSSISERIQLARCSTSLLQHVSRECTSLWVNIDFSNEEKKKMKKLSDDMLISFLERTNAKQVTKSLDVQCCNAIRGSGLEPLRFSLVLERINLGKGNAFEEEDVLFQTLRTILPYKLREVRICKPRSNARRFLHDLERQKVVDRTGAVCDNRRCKHPITVGPDGVPVSRCFECNGRFCSSPSCLEHCFKCDGLFCSSSSCSKECFECNRSCCKDCDGLRNCLDCELSVCSDCKVTPHRNEYKECTHCKEIMCGDCILHHYSGLCSYCPSFSCQTGNCSKLMHCYGCHGDICSDCTNGQSVAKCTLCTRTFCKECKYSDHIVQCEDCKKHFCNDGNPNCQGANVWCRSCEFDSDDGHPKNCQGVNVCTSCEFDNARCLGCGGMEQCSNCSKKLCDECKDMFELDMYYEDYRCDVCGVAFCLDCVESAKACNICFGKMCDTCIAHSCEVCGVVFCGGCAETDLACQGCCCNVGSTACSSDGNDAAEPPKK